MKIFRPLNCIGLLILLLSTGRALKANEGMWLLSLLKKYNAEELYKMGLKIPVEKISGGKEEVLSEAVVRFGGGCTGSIISDQGLILTNYHCSYGAIQQHTSLNNNIVENGFWAAGNQYELPVSGLKISITKKIADVSGDAPVPSNIPGKEGLPLQAMLEKISKKFQQEYPDCKVIVKSYRNNLIFVLYVQQEYSDVRLVGLAPKSIAKFGGETDNWMWPRFSADFAFFRVYTSSTGKPANFSPANIPMKATSFLKLSTAGYKQEDFAMSLGFPGFSDRQAASFTIYNKRYAQNPPLVAVRKLRLAILEEEMAKNEVVKMTYAEKYSTSANYYKNAVGMNEWIDRMDIINKKKKEENKWLNELALRKDTSFSLKDDIDRLDASKETGIEAGKALAYYLECFNETCDIINFITAFANGFKNFAQDIKKNPSQKNNYLSNTTSYYSKFNPAVDKRLTKEVLRLLKDSLPARFLPDIFEKYQLHTKDDIDRYVESVFSNSVFADSFLLKEWIANPRKDLADDPAMQLAESIRKQQEILRKDRSWEAQRSKINHRYKISRDVYGTGSYYPDADNTMRLSYGKVSDLNNGIQTLPFQTTLGGLIARSASTNKDYYLHPLLNEMWQHKEFGSYYQSNDIPTCFITDGDVTGGNSGSPMLDGYGNLIGLVFDCNWESMTREFNFEASLHRVICVDIRYILAITEKLSGNKKLLKELVRQ